MRMHGVMWSEDNFVASGLSFHHYPGPGDPNQVIRLAQLVSHMSPLPDLFLMSYLSFKLSFVLA